MSEIRYISVPEAIAVNVAVIQKYSIGEHIGVKDSRLTIDILFKKLSKSLRDTLLL